MLVNNYLFTDKGIAETDFYETANHKKTSLVTCYRQNHDTFNFVRMSSFNGDYAKTTLGKFEEVFRMGMKGGSDRETSEWNVIEKIYCFRKQFSLI